MGAPNFQAWCAGGRRSRSLGHVRRSTTRAYAPCGRNAWILIARYRNSAPEREAPISPFTGPDSCFPSPKIYRHKSSLATSLPNQGRCPALFPPPRSPDEEHTATPGISSATSPTLLASSVGKCHCNTCSSRHIPLALTLQPLAKLGPAIRRDKDPTVPGPLRCASLFSDARNLPCLVPHIAFAMWVGSLSMIRAVTFHLAFSHADGCEDYIIAFGGHRFWKCRLPLRVTPSPYAGWKLDEKAQVVY